MSIDTPPYRMANDGRLVGDPWRRRGGAGESGGILEALADWDPSEDLVFARTVQFDAAGVREDTGLPTGWPLKLGVVWRSADARSRGAGNVVLVEGDRVDEELHVSIQGTQLSSSVELITLVTLGMPIDKAPIRAWRAGSILWQDAQSIDLSGGSRFPMQSIPFSGWAWPAGAIWRLEWDASELDVAVLGSLCVYLNQDHPLHAALVGRANEPQAHAIRAAMYHDIARQLIRGALDSDEFQADRKYPARSIGRTIQGLINSAFRGVGLEHLRQEMRQSPEVFEARLQDRLRLFEGVG